MLQDSHQKLYTYFHTNKQSGSALSVLLYFTHKDVLTEDTSLKFNTFIDKWIDFFDKNVLMVLLFYKYSI